MVDPSSLESRSPPALPQLSSYLPVPTTISSTNSVIAVKKRRNSIEGAFLAVSPRPATPPQLENDQRKRKSAPKQVSMNVEENKAASFSRLDSIYHSKEVPTIPVVDPENISISSTTSSHDSDTSNYFALQSSTPRRERTSRYLSEADRREIITRVDGGEKQVALAREFKVSRAAICNLYKKRWEVLTRGDRNPESKHPKKTRKKASPRLAPQLMKRVETNILVSETSYPDVSTMSIQAANQLDFSMKEPTRGEHERADQDSTLLVAEASSASQPEHLRQLERHNSFQQKEVHDEQSHSDDQMRSPVTSKSFLVHEASAYSYPCRNLVAALRDESISTVVFQQRIMRLARLLIEEALTCLPHEDVQIKNRFGDICHAARSLDEKDICGVSMEDKGMVLLRAFSTISPASPTGVISIETKATRDDSKDLTPQSILHAQLPPLRPHQLLLLLDIQCSTGNEACTVLHHLVNERNIAPKRIYFVTVISSFEGLQNVFQHFPDVTLIAAQVDTVLDENDCIRPGIGNFMQRYWNVRSGAPY